MISIYYNFDLWFLQNWFVFMFYMLSTLVLGMCTNSFYPGYGYPMIFNCLCNTTLVIIGLYFLMLKNTMKSLPIKVLLPSGFEYTYWTYYVQLFMALMLFFLIFLMKFYAQEHKFDYEYVILILFSVSGLLMLITCSDFLTFFLALEMYSLPTYILISFNTVSPKSTEAGLKYFILGSFFSALLLFGMSCMYLVTGTTNFNQLHDLLYMSWSSKEALLVFGIILIAISFAFKMSAVPFHVGTPDAYEGAPFMTTVYLNVIPKIPLYTIYFIIFNKCFYLYNFIWNKLFIFFGLCSIIWAAFGILYQFKLMSLFTYSMISNTGFFIIPLSLNDTYNMATMFFFQVMYSMMMFGIFLILFTFRSSSDKYSFDKISVLMNLYKMNPGLAIVFATFLFSLGSMPPLVGFFGKYALFVGILDFNLMIVSFMLILSSMLSMITYLRLLKYMFFSEDENCWFSFCNMPMPISCLIAFIFILNLVMFFSPFLVMDIYSYMFYSYFI